MALRVLIESLIFLLALLLGLLAYKNMQKFQRLYFLQLVLWVLFYSFSHIIILQQAKHNQVQNNQWLYNVSTFFEIIILLLAALNFSQDTKVRQLIILSIVLYVGIDVCTLYVQDLHKFNVIGFVFGTLFITIFYANMLYKIISTSTEKPWQEPMFWICLGILLFYVCNLPYFSFFNYLNTNHLQLSILFYKIITQVLANIRYLLLGLGFWFIIRKPLPST